jgi:hypothetical protein
MTIDGLLTLNGTGMGCPPSLSIGGARALQAVLRVEAAREYDKCQPVQYCSDRIGGGLVPGELPCVAKVSVL